MWNWVRELEQATATGRPVALVTVVHVSGSTPREVGAKMIVHPDGTFAGTIGGGQLEMRVIDDARRCLTTRTPETLRYPLGAKAGQCCGGVMDLLVECLNVGPRLYLFGGGHVGQAVCSVLEGTPFTVDLIEEREEWINADALPGSVRRHREGWEQFLSEAPFEAEQTYVAVMTHRHDIDQEIVADLVRRPLRYLGLIGSVAKWHRFQQRLDARGYTRAELDRVQCPMGLPLGGGKTPKEVAISIAAELLRRHHAQAPASLNLVPSLTNEGTR